MSNWEIVFPKDIPEQLNGYVFEKGADFLSAQCEHYLRGDLTAVNFSYICLDTVWTFVFQVWLWYVHVEVRWFSQPGRFIIFQSGISTLFKWLMLVLLLIYGRRACQVIELWFPFSSSGTHGVFSEKNSVRNIAEQGYVVTRESFTFLELLRFLHVNQILVHTVRQRYPLTTIFSICICSGRCSALQSCMCSYVLAVERVIAIVPCGIDINLWRIETSWVSEFPISEILISIPNSLAFSL